MDFLRTCRPGNGVALHPEGVDRNYVIATPIETPLTVALHPEGVDRNGRKC